LSLAGHHVLVIDDNAESRALLEELLTLWQVRWETAASAEKAFNLLAAADANRFSALLIDQEMPEVNGEQLCAKILQYPALAQIPMILMTPLSQSADGERWIRAGFSAFISKPVKQGELGANLATVLGRPRLPAISRAPLQFRRAGLKPRAEMRLLVVEDNKVNQMVALGILKQLGYQADLAEDGASALAALAQKDYDLVLMDCQMPGMDGYEASRRIRQPETPVRNHNVPIIAATAHALSGDREKCLAAGMDGYITKPLRSDTLEDAIHEWTSGRGGTSEPPEPEAEVAKPDPAGFDHEDLLDRLMGDEELARHIVRGFVDDMPRQLAALAKAVGKRDSGQVRHVAHSIKGTAGNVSGMEVQKAAAKLEKDSTDGDLSGAAASLRELSRRFDEVRPAMEHFSQCEPADR
jgi:CheY-like chemotaxis protein